MIETPALLLHQVHNQCCGVFGTALIHGCLQADCLHEMASRHSLSLACGKWVAICFGASIFFKCANNPLRTFTIDSRATKMINPWEDTPRIWFQSALHCTGNNLVMGPTITGEKVNVIALLWLPHVPYMNSRRLLFPIFLCSMWFSPESRNDSRKRFTSTYKHAREEQFNSLWKLLFCGHWFYLLDYSPWKMML